MAPDSVSECLSQECKQKFVDGIFFRDRNEKVIIKKVNNFIYMIYQDKKHKQVRERMKRYRQRVKLDILTHYGGSFPKCACCGESHKEFLVIDHIGGGGCQHRRKYKLTAGAHFYSWLRRNNYPSGFQILCDNCNMSLSRYGYCPYKRK